MRAMDTRNQEQETNEIRLADLTLPQDLKKLTIPQCRRIAKEIRALMVRTISKNGGHLASNLGCVELTMALHRVFDSPQDKLIWDVGHQCYTHKILTGRLREFRTIRKENGLAGFPKPSESEHDICISGHSSTSISMACGLAEAMRMRGDKHHAIAILGDGALTGGLAFEGLNNGGKEKLGNLIVILNDNNMSISGNVGAVSSYLRKIREKEGYVRSKQELERTLRETPGIGMPTIKVLKKTKDSFKRVVMKQATMFEQMGFVYLGPVDGHDQQALEEVLRAAKRYEAPVLVHVKTVKGKGYGPAEKDPSRFHGVSQFDIITGNPEVSGADCYSAEFGKALTALAHEDARICAITAAMEYGTGLQYFDKAFPERFFDVGIAEQHAVTFAAGLAIAGHIPVFAVYSTFLQRAYDQLIHDVAIAGLHVVLGIDRAGIVGEDGETHQGMFDVPMLTSIPGTTIYSPAGYEELRACLRRAVLEDKGLTAVRYPRGSEQDMSLPPESCNTDYYYHEEPGADILLISYGRVCHSLWAAHDTCGKIGYKTSLLKLTRIFPVDEALVELALGYKTVIFFEESSGYGGISTIFGSLLSQYAFGGRYVRVSADRFIPHAKVDALLEKAELSAHAVCRYIYAYGEKSHES